MKITRSQLINLINEAMYKFGKAPRTLDFEIQKFDDEIKKSDERIELMLSPRQRDNLSDFDEKDPNYAEVLKLSLDPDRPEVRRLKQTFETVSVYQHPNLEIAIPKQLVDDVIAAHQAISKQPAGQIFLVMEAVFREAGMNVFNYIEDEVKRIYGSDKIVYEYGLDTRGYREDEYNAAMNAVSEYM